MATRDGSRGRTFRPSADRLEVRLVMSGNSGTARVAAILRASGGVSPTRPNTPVLPFEAPAVSATFLDPTVAVVQGQRISIGRKDLIAPFATLNASKGAITIGSSTAIEDDATLLANPGLASNSTLIAIGDFVVVGDGATIEGPSTIGAKGGAPTSIGADALIDGATVQPGAFVGALARVGPGVTIPTGYRVLPGADVTTQPEATDPALGDVVKVTASDPSATNAYREIQDSIALAGGYASLYEGNSATGGAASAGPVPSAIAAAGSTTYFGALNAVLGASSEPTSKYVSFEPSAGTPTFIQATGAASSLAPNHGYKLGARFIGNVEVEQSAAATAKALGKGDTVRADEGQPITIGSIASLGNDVSIRSPLGGVQGTTTTSVTTTVTDTVTDATTTTSTTSTVTTSAAPTAAAGTTVAATTGVNAAGHATTGTVVTTIGTKVTTIGTIKIGDAFVAGAGSVIQGNPTESTTIGDGVTVGAGAVVVGSTIGNNAVIGERAYVANSTIPAGTIVPDGAIDINNQIIGFNRW